MSLSIAGVRFDFSSSVPLTLRDPRSVYPEFVDGFLSALDTCARCPVQITAGSGPALQPQDRIFDSGSLWSYYARGDRRAIALHDPNLAPPHVWTAVLDPAAPSAEVFCEPSCVRHADGGDVLVNPVCHPLDQFLCMYLLASRHGLVLHACGFETAGRGIVLAGRSGAGKTTSARLLQPRGDLTIFSDDRMIVRRHGAEWRMHGTPWPGDAGIARNRSAPLSALVFLTQAADNAIVPLAAGDALRRLLIVASVPWFDRPHLEGPLATVEALLARVPCFEFRFRKDPTAADALVKFAAALPA